MELEFYGNEWYSPTAQGNDYKKPRDVRGVYVIIKSSLRHNDEILYIGSSGRLKTRLKDHEIIKDCAKRGIFPVVRFKPMQRGYWQEEVRLIKKYKPSLNKLHNE